MRNDDRLQSVQVTPTVTPSVDARSNVIKKEPMLPTLVYTARPTAAAFSTSSNNLQTATAASRLINQVSSQSTTNRVLTTARIARVSKTSPFLRSEFIYH